MKYIFVFKLVVFNLKHTKGVCSHVYITGGSGGGGGAPGIHLEAKGAPDWKNLGTTVFVMARIFLMSY